MTEVVNGTVRRTAHPILTRKIWESIGKLQGKLKLFFPCVCGHCSRHFSTWTAKKQKTDIDSIVTELEETDQGLGFTIYFWLKISFRIKAFTL